MTRSGFLGHQRNMRRGWERLLSRPNTDINKTSCLILTHVLLFYPSSPPFFPILFHLRSANLIFPFFYSLLILSSCFFRPHEILLIFYQSVIKKRTKYSLSLFFLLSFHLIYFHLLVLTLRPIHDSRPIFFPSCKIAVPFYHVVSSSFIPSFLFNHSIVLPYLDIFTPIFFFYPLFLLSLQNVLPFTLHSHPSHSFASTYHPVLYSSFSLLIRHTAASCVIPSPFASFLLNFPSYLASYLSNP